MATESVGRQDLLFAVLAALKDIGRSLREIREAVDEGFADLNDIFGDDE